MAFKRECECGIIVSGRTEAILDANFKRHKKSKPHEKQMELKNELKLEQEK